MILNLVLAAAFLGFAANQLSQATNVTALLKDEQAKHEATKTKLTAENSALTTQVNQLKTDLSTAKDERDQNKTALEGKIADLAHEKATNASLLGEVTGIKESLNGYNMTIASLTSQKDALVKEKEDAFAARSKAESEKDKADEARREAELTVAKANTQIETLERAKTTAEKTSSKLDAELKQVYAVTNIPRIGTPQKLVEGAVINVDTSVAPGLLAINKGSKDGINKGTMFDVYNGGTYKGRAQVALVKDDMCSALITLEVKEAKISQGDRVTTQL
ncbi:MAG TPA: hypothetical protein VM509_00810 [Planctomycetota bacterium]|nr:hypothetical protein [Planctomycetota bacterium]